MVSNLDENELVICNATYTWMSKQIAKSKITPEMGLLMAQMSQILRVKLNEERGEN